MRLRPRRNLEQTRVSAAYRARLVHGFQLLGMFAQSCSIDLPFALASPARANVFLARFLQHAYDNRTPFLHARHAVLAAQFWHPPLRGHLQRAWLSLRSWSLEVPSQHRVPIPLKIVHVLAATALLQTHHNSLADKAMWFCFSVLCRLAFHGLLRPSEFLSLRRQDVYICDIQGSRQLVVHIRDPKNRIYMGRSQFVLIEDQATISWVQWLIEDLPSSTLLWPHSIGRARVCLRTVLRARSLTHLSISLGSFRAGGATHMFQLCQDVGRIQLKGRWASVRSLTCYIQEAMCTLVLAQLDDAQFDAFLRATAFLAQPPPLPRTLICPHWHHGPKRNHRMGSLTTSGLRTALQW